MSRTKSAEKKRMLGSAMKKSRKLPVLAQIRTHRRIQYNKFGRNWRKRKLDLKVD
jgi:ribosomal protein L39E